MEHDLVCADGRRSHWRVVPCPDGLTVGLDPDVHLVGLLFELLQFLLVQLFGPAAVVPDREHGALGDILQDDPVVQWLGKSLQSPLRRHEELDSIPTLTDLHLGHRGSHLDLRFSFILPKNITGQDVKRLISCIFVVGLDNSLGNGPLIIFSEFEILLLHK